MNIPQYQNNTRLASRAKREGQTLLELLIYVAIFSLAAGVFSSVLVVFTRVQGQEAASSEVTQQLSFVQSTIQRLVREAVNIENTAGATSTVLTLRMAATSTDPTIISADSQAIYLQQGTGATSSLTSDRVKVSQFEVVKYENPGGHAVIQVDLSLTYNSNRLYQQVTRNLKTAIGRVTAATFDDNLLPNKDNEWSIGIPPTTRWKSLSLSNLLNLGQLTTDPVDAQNGSIYYNTASSTFRGYASSSWSNLGGVGWAASSTDIYNTNSGNVGIGTMGPTQKFQVNDTATAAFVVTSAGQVGIGTASPNDTLEVNGSIITTGIQDTGKITKMFLSGAAAAKTLDYMEYSTDALAQAAYVSSDTTVTYGNDLLPTDGTGLTASSYYDVNTPAKSCDNNVNTLWWENNADYHWIKVDFGVGVTKIVTQLTITPGEDNRIKDFTLSGSNNDSSYTDIYTGQHAQTTSKETYQFTNTTAYRYYKLTTTTAWAGSTYNVKLAEWELMEGQPNLQCYSESTIKTQGSYSLKGFATITDSLNKTLTRTVSPTIDLSNVNTIKYWAYALRTGSNFKVSFHDSGGNTIDHTPNIIQSNTWEEQIVDISGVSNANKDVIDKIIVTIVNADAANTFYIDNMYSPSTGTSTDITFTTAGSERMRIDASGNVGIGTADPGSYKLKVAGTISVNSGTNIVYRCTTAGTLPVGALTINSGNCGASVDTGLSVN